MNFRCARLPTFVLDVACNGQLFLQSQVEEEKEESSHIFAREMMEEAISQILSLSEGGEEREVRLHTRLGKAQIENLNGFVIKVVFFQGRYDSQAVQAIGEIRAVLSGKPEEKDRRG